MDMHRLWPNKSRLEVARIIAVIVLVTATIFVFYFWRLGSLTAGLGPAEVNARSSSSSLSLIANDLSYAPHKVLQYAATTLIGDSALVLRSISVVFAIVFLFSFFGLVKSWFAKTISLFATLLLGATPWFILLARSAGPEISLLAPIAVLASYYWLVRSKRFAAWIALIVSVGLVVYLPGGLILILIGIIAARHGLKQAIQSLNLPKKILSSIAVLMIFAPIVYSASTDPGNLMPLFLIPSDWLSIWATVKSAAWNVLSLFWRTPQHTDFIVGRLPMFDGSLIILSLFGGYALFRLAKSKLYPLVGILIFGILASTISRQPVLLTLVMPVIAIFAAAGLRYLYVEWRSVFPKNPLPKYMALALISLLIAVHLYYGLRYSQAAWPNTTETRSTFVLK